jgi:nicotinate-nucleotide adenylyltransferase
MTRLCFGSESKSKYHSEIRVDLTELEISHARSPGFTFDVLTALERKGQNLEKLAFVMGTDQLARFHTWHRYRELLSLCHWIVLARKPEGDRQAQKTLADWQGSGLAESAGPHVWRLMPRQTPAGRSPKSMILVETSAPALSSTGIREALGRTGEVPEKSLPELVSRYLKLHRIYGTAEHPSEHCPR